MLKIVTLINWIGIGILAILVLVLLVEPNRGGDAASKGLGQAFSILGSVALAVLLLLNLLPYNWTKYAAFGILMLPFAAYALNAVWGNLKTLQTALKPDGFNQDGTPWFKDKQRQNLALAIFHGDVQKVQTLLKQGGPDLLSQDETGGSLLEFAISEAAYSSYKPDEKVVCVQALFKAGAKLSAKEDDIPAIIAPAFSGNAALVKVLLAHGADPNAKGFNGRPALFEAIISYQKPYETVQALLDAGADPNTLYTDVDSMTTSALLHAAASGRWKTCCLLIDRGADIRYADTGRRTLENLIRENSAYFQGDSYSTVEDLKRLKELAKQ